MTPKDMAIKTIRELPDSATWEDIEERVRFLRAIDKGLADVREGKVVAPRYSGRSKLMVVIGDPMAYHGAGDESFGKENKEPRV